MSAIEEILNDRITPRWARDLDRLLPIKSQFIFSHNIRDSFLMMREQTSTDTDPKKYNATDFIGLLWEILKNKGFSRIEIYDPIDGLQTYSNGVYSGPNKMPPEKFADEIKGRLDGDERIAVVIDYASRIDHENKLFVTCEKLATQLQPKMLQITKEPFAFHNPLIWLFNREEDIPSWYGGGNHKIHRHIIPRPDLDQRFKQATRLLPTGEEQQIAYSKIFAAMTDGFMLAEMSDVMRLSKMNKKFLLADIDDAVRSYKTGDPTLDNPWKSSELHTRISTAHEEINKCVLGQSNAVLQALDILKRSVLGLTGAQTSSSNNRPRGVLFLAGPTGVGKTELAKRLTKLLFADENACIRFDMSEFSHEHSDARLLGAPPGYVGYEGGGELINAIRQQPFSLLLFDEIEKAHGKILDKFLQILEDGRITSGQGETVYFSESIIVFTSNLGITKEERNEFGVLVEAKPVVTCNDSYATVKEEVKAGIEFHFCNELRRPELLNRLGDNIVVFDFIRPEIADQIFDIMLKKISDRIREEHNADLLFDNNVTNFLRDECKRDLRHGGRGIGNCLEAVLINPLARNLFGMGSLDKKKITVLSIKKTKDENSDSEFYKLETNIEQDQV